MKRFQNNISGFLIALAAILPSCAQVEVQDATHAPVLNRQVLAAVQSMPSGGGYEASQKAVARLAASVTFKEGVIHQDLKTAKASFCSGATYVVLLRVINQLQKNNSLRLPTKTHARYANIGVKDGEEIFGRWNANGPGTAKFFSDLKCGVNFTSYAHAQPGDFMKMWWTDAIGGKERGHLVVYLGSARDQIHFWSSNQPNGYSRKSVSKSKIKHVLFSRLTHPERLKNASLLSPKDQFLADMLRKDSTWAQVAAQCHVKETP